MSAPVAVVLESTVEADTPQVEIAELRDNSEEIAAELRRLGYRTEIVPFVFDTAQVRGQLARLKPGVVFNLVDSIEGKGNLIALAPMLLAHMGLPFTGATALATTVSCDKLLAKQVLRGAGVRTADWLTEAQIEAGGAELERPYILKSISEHASFGIFADSIVHSRAELKARWQEKRRAYGSEWFAEAYIEGREFNQALLATDDPAKAAAMPSAEITFTSDFPEGKPRIIDYSAKWHADTPEYKGTVRRFDLPAADAALLASLKSIAQTCWQAFGLTGYARIDYRVDAQGAPYVLEVNCNPFLSAKEGFGMATKQAGFSFADTVRAIVADAYRRVRLPLPEMLAA
jgi:D-alanine-D-alanine ligase